MEHKDLGAVRRCKYRPCSGAFFPKRKDHVFCAPACKTKYTMTAYEKGVEQMEKPLGKIHAGKVENSPYRLKPILDLLLDGDWHTGLEVVTAGNTTAPGSAIQELKHPVNGYLIESRCLKRTASNRPLWEYRLTGRVHEHV